MAALEQQDQQCRQHHQTGADHRRHPPGLPPPRRQPLLERQPDDHRQIVTVEPLEGDHAANPVHRRIHQGDPFRTVVDKGGKGFAIVDPGAEDPVHGGIADQKGAVTAPQREKAAVLGPHGGEQAHEGLGREGGQDHAPEGAIGPR